MMELLKLSAGNEMRFEARGLVTRRGEVVV
jgi:hypothetical protein